MVWCKKRIFEDEINSANVIKKELEKHKQQCSLCKEMVLAWSAYVDMGAVCIKCNELFSLRKNGLLEFDKNLSNLVSYVSHNAPNIDLKNFGQVRDKIIEKAQQHAQDKYDKLCKQV